ncbi:MAG TPA: helix-turn-helix transcriptional regulator [Capsulimonadaceae bacterium]|jgi:transcriptional regulator with XRE-family HTH domain
MTDTNPLESPEIGERIAERRQSRRITQAEVAEVLGVSRSTVSQYETGRLSVSTQELHKLVRFLQAPLSYFLGETDLEDVIRHDMDYYKIDSLELNSDQRRLLMAYHEMSEESQETLLKVAEMMRDAEIGHISNG